MYAGLELIMSLARSAAVPFEAVQFVGGGWEWKQVDSRCAQQWLVRQC